MQSVLIDTNVLLLLIVGSWDRHQIESHRKTAVYTGRDFDLLRAQLGHYARFLTTPSVVTETSNLMGNDFHATIAEVLISVVRPFVEVINPKEQVFQQEAFDRLGFGDASVLAALEKGPCSLPTTSTSTAKPVTKATRRLTSITFARRVPSGSSRVG